MSTWQEQFDSHALKPGLTELQNQLAGYEGTSSEDEWESEWLPHIGYLTRRLLGLLDATDAELVTAASLDAATVHVSTIRDQVAALPAAPDPNVPKSLIQASADSLALLISTWPAYEQAKNGVAPKELANLRKELERTKSELDSIRSEVKSKTEEMNSQLQGVSTAIEASQSEIAAQREAAIADLSNRNDELAVTIESQKARLDQAIADFQAQFSASQETRSTASEEARAAQQAAFEKAINEADVKLNDDFAGRAADAQTILDQLLELKKDAERTTEAIGMAGMAGGYKVDADQQKKNADWLRIGAIGGLILTAIAALISLLTSHTDSGLDYKSFFAKLLVSAAIGSISAYAIVQSAHHRERERQDRRLQIELASIDSYLALMPDDKKTEIKANLAEAWFGNPLEQLPTSDAEGGLTISAAQLAKVLIENMTKK